MFAKRLLAALALCVGTAAPVLPQEAASGTWFHDCRPDEWTGRKICKATYRAQPSEQRPAASLHVVVRQPGPIVVINVIGVPMLKVAALRVDTLPLWSTELCTGASCTFTQADELIDDMLRAKNISVRFQPRNGAMQEVIMPLTGFGPALEGAKQDLGKE